MAETKSATAVDKHVGQRVRMRRIQLGMSQEKLGHSLGLTFQQVQKYEKGANRISAGKLVEISKALKVPVAFFFQDLPGAPKEELASPTFSNFQAKLAREVRDVENAAQQALILALVRELATYFDND